MPTADILDFKTGKKSTPLRYPVQFTLSHFDVNAIPSVTWCYGVKAVFEIFDYGEQGFTMEIPVNPNIQLSRMFGDIDTPPGLMRFEAAKRNLAEANAWIAEISKLTTHEELADEIRKANR